MCNNYNDCWENNCEIRSFTKMFHHVNSKDNISDFDVNYMHGYLLPEVKETIKGAFHILLISEMWCSFSSIIMIKGKSIKNKPICVLWLRCGRDAI